MTIKQYGGVFGRNPTFNDVTIEGNLIINGEVFTGLDFQGSWNASTNSPALASSVGTNGEFYIVSVAGSTDLNGITNWGIGDWALFNGSVWQRVEGGADGNFVNITATGLSTLNEVQVDSININDDTVGFYRDDPTIYAGNQLGVVQWGGADGGNTSNAAIKVVAGSSNWAPSSTSTDIQFWTTDVGSDTARKVITVDENGNLVFANAGNGIDFSATAGTGTSELLDDYEEGVFTPTWTPASGSGATIVSASGWYTKTGNRVFVDIFLATNGHGTSSGNLTLGGLPFAQTTNSGQNAALSCGQAANAGLVAGQAGTARVNQSATTITPLVWSAAAGTTTMTAAQWGVSGTWRFTGSYQTA
jgi:hypothetical protein